MWIELTVKHYIPENLKGKIPAEIKAFPEVFSSEPKRLWINMDWVSTISFQEDHAQLTLQGFRGRVYNVYDAAQIQMLRDYLQGRDKS